MLLITEITTKKIQLGAGLGLCGILAHRLGAASVLLTDGDTDTLVNLRANVAHNCSGGNDADVGDNLNKRSPAIQCKQLVWGNESLISSLNCSYDIILGSDIIYLEEILDPLWDTVSQLLVPNTGRFLLAYARRNVPIDLVFAAASERGFEWERLDDVEGVFVFRRQTSENINKSIKSYS